VRGQRRDIFLIRALYDRGYKSERPPGFWLDSDVHKYEAALIHAVTEVLYHEYIIEIDSVAPFEAAPVVEYVCRVWEERLLS